MPSINVKNRTLFKGDNLDFLRAINSESIDLIATDPPFNKGKDFHATPDSLASGAKFQDRWSWDRDVEEAWVDQLEDDYPNLYDAIVTIKLNHSESMAAFCCFLATRVLAFHRVLKPTGSLYLHCDPTANVYIKLILDSIFGVKNFRNEIIWHHPKIGIATNKFTSNTDTIYFYTKSGDYWFVPQRKDEPNELYRRWGKKIIDNVLYYREAKTIKDSPAQSKVRQRQKELGRELVDDDVIVDFNDPANKKAYDNCWKHPFLRGNSAEHTGYPTQKPIALYQRIIEASCPEGGWVLDPFAGCATTCVAAEITGRKWIGMDLWDKAGEVTEERLQRECDNFFGGEVNFTSVLPTRTDDGQTAAPALSSKFKVGNEPPGPRMSREEMKNQLLVEHGFQCQGCDHTFFDERYLELDHIVPKRDGGINHISNRILLCGPCNRLKGADRTLSGLRKENKKRGYMAS